MDFDSKSENVEYKEEHPTRYKAEPEREEGGSKRRKNKDVEAEDYSPSRARSKSRPSKTKKKVEMFWGKLVFKILVVVAVFFNFKFLLNFMKQPLITIYHTLFVLGICAAINFVAVWILFYKRSWMRFYLSLAALLGSFGYYIYVNYTNQSFLGNNLPTSVLVLISVLLAISKVNYYTKSFLFLLIPIIGVYFSGNTFALVWTLMFNAGLILIFRVTKSKKKEDRKKRDQKQSA